MLDPSSSEDTGGESDPEVVQAAPRKTAASAAGKRGSRGGQQRPSAGPGAKARGKGAKDGSAAGEDDDEEEEEEEERKERERVQKEEEEERKTKLQIYVFVLRCIAYPFNAKQPTDMARRQQKIPGDGAHLRGLCNLSYSPSSSSSSQRSERMSQQGAP